MKKINLQIIYNKEKKASGYILDITYSGIGIVCSKNIPALTKVCIAPKSKDLVKLNGKVVYCIKMEGVKNKYKAGVKFVSPTKKQADSLISFIEKTNRREFSRLGFI